MTSRHYTKKPPRLDENWKPVWGEVAQIRNHYNELAVTLNQKGVTQNHVFACLTKVLVSVMSFPSQKTLFILNQTEEPNL
jgi:hypothetical protein